jgi:hypothetical protein
LATNAVLHRDDKGAVHALVRTDIQRDYLDQDARPLGHLHQVI